jgi:sugar phosphate isomerase/epimerase
MIDRVYLCPEQSNAEQVCREARRLGASLEIGEFAYPKVLDSGFDKALNDSLSWSRDLAYPVTLHGAFVDMYPGSPDHRVRALARLSFEKGLKAARILDASLVVFHSGYNPMLRGPGRLDGWVKRAAELWTSILQSSRYGGTIAIENMWEPSPEPMRLLCEAVNRPDFGVCLDTGHMNVFSRATPEEWVKQLSPWLRYLHVDDNHGEWDEHLATGRGNFDFDGFFSLLRSAGAGPLGALMEVTEPENQVASLEWLRERGLLLCPAQMSGPG